MAKPSRQLACCPRCRLVHPSLGQRCRCCGAPHVTVESGSLVTARRRRRWQRRTPAKRGWRWFDLVFIGLSVVAPLEAERYASSWFVPALLAVFASWLAVRVVVALVARYRLVSTLEPPRVSAVSFPPSTRPSPSAPAVSGVARRQSETVDAQLLSRRCLASALTIEPAAALGTVRLRQDRTAAFSIEQQPDGERVAVSGPMILLGEAAATRPAKQVADCFVHQGSRVQDVWFDDAMAREVLLQNRNRVQVEGGIRQDNGDIVGEAGNPVWVRIS